MPFRRTLTTLSIGALAAAVLSGSPAQAATGWSTRLTFQDARAQVCVDVQDDGTPNVQIRMNNRRGDLKVKALIVEVDDEGKPYRALRLTEFAGPGEISEARSYGGLAADDLFYVAISQRFDEGAGIVKESGKPLLVSAQTPC